MRRKTTSRTQDNTDPWQPGMNPSTNSRRRHSETRIEPRSQENPDPWAPGREPQTRTKWVQRKDGGWQRPGICDPEDSDDENFVVIDDIDDPEMLDELGNESPSDERERDGN